MSYLKTKDALVCFKKKNLYLKVSYFVLPKRFQNLKFLPKQALFKKKRFSKEKEIFKEVRVSLQNFSCISNILKTSHPLQNV
jgi:hypothetical protein